MGGRLKLVLRFIIIEVIEAADDFDCVRESDCASVSLLLVFAVVDVAAVKEVILKMDVRRATGLVAAAGGPDADDPRRSLISSESFSSYFFAGVEEDEVEEEAEGRPRFILLCLGVCFC